MTSVMRDPITRLGVFAHPGPPSFLTGWVLGNRLNCVWVKLAGMGWIGATAQAMNAVEISVRAVAPQGLGRLIRFNEADRTQVLE